VSLEWNSQFFNTYINLSRHQFCYFTVASLIVLGKSTAWKRCLQHPCIKNLCKIAQASKNSDSNAEHFLSDLLTHSWFHSMLFALPGYQSPFSTVMNRCFYLCHGPFTIHKLTTCPCNTQFKCSSDLHPTKLTTFCSAAEYFNAVTGKAIVRAWRWRWQWPLYMMSLPLPPPLHPASSKYSNWWYLIASIQRAYDRGESAVSCRWTGWSSSGLQENYGSF
jgi:hypothetical protein